MENYRLWKTNGWITIHCERGDMGAYLKYTSSDGKFKAEVTFNPSKLSGNNMYQLL
jgi:hypothetical protein